MAISIGQVSDENLIRLAFDLMFQKMNHSHSPCPPARPPTTLIYITISRFFLSVLSFLWTPHLFIIFSNLFRTMLIFRKIRHFLSDEVFLEIKNKNIIRKSLLSVFFLSTFSTYYFLFFFVGLNQINRFPSLSLSPLSPYVSLSLSLYLYIYLYIYPW